MMSNSGLEEERLEGNEISATSQRINRAGHTVFRRELRCKVRIFQAEFVLFLLTFFHLVFFIKVTLL